MWFGVAWGSGTPFTRPVGAAPSAPLAQHRSGLRAERLPRLRPVAEPVQTEVRLRAGRHSGQEAGRRRGEGLGLVCLRQMRLQLLPRRDEAAAVPLRRTGHVCGPAIEHNPGDRARTAGGVLGRVKGGTAQRTLRYRRAHNGHWAWRGGGCCTACAAHAHRGNH